MRTLLIGLGRIGFELEQDRLRYHPCTHAGTLRAFNDALPTRSRKHRPFELAGICDVRSGQIDAFRRWWGDRELPAEEDYRRLLKTTAPDLVIIATSVESHAKIAREAMRAGASGVLLEKPIGYNHAQARNLLRAAEEYNTRVWVNFERRYHPAYRLARKYIMDETLGPLRHVSGRALTGRMRPDPRKTVPYAEGPLLHDAVHWLDLLLWMCGKPRAFQARLDLAHERERKGMEDTTRIAFEYDDFAAYLESGGRRRYFEFEMQLDFEAGRIQAGNAGHFYFRAGASKRYAKFRELRPFSPKIPTANPWLELYREINGELTRHPTISTRQYAAALKRISSGLLDAAAGMEIIDRCYRQVKTK